MKRDMDLVREILLVVEGIEPGAEVSKEMLAHLADYPVLAEHVRWLERGGIIEASLLEVEGLNYPALFTIYRLTWEGADFLESIRDPEVWRQTKAKLVVKGGALTFDLVKAVATAYVKGALGLN
jgi:hypothetical protein